MNNYLIIIIAYILGIITGVITTLLLNKKNFETDKVISLLIIGLWTSFHSISFFTELQVAWIFDVIGAGATGHVIGLDLVELFAKIKKK